MSKVFVKNKKGMMIMDRNDVELSLMYKTVGNKKISTVVNGERYLVDVPVVTRKTSKELFTLMLCSLIGAGVFYTLMVLMIGLAPLNR